jgi:hypothetical protein
VTEAFKVAVAARVPAEQNGKFRLSDEAYLKVGVSVFRVVLRL